MYHETTGVTPDTAGGSDRSFGAVFATVLTVAALAPVRTQGEPRWWLLGMALALAVIAWWRPAWLRLGNRLWTNLGHQLGLVVSPIALGLVYYGVVTPIALVLRLLGKDPLRLRREPATDSYWINRPGPLPPPGSMRNHF